MRSRLEIFEIANEVTQIHLFVEAHKEDGYQRRYRGVDWDLGSSIRNQERSAANPPFCRTLKRLVRKFGTGLERNMGIAIK